MIQKLIIPVFLLSSVVANAAEIRFYSIDKFGRQDEIMIWGRGDKPGCHNFRKPKEIFRVAVIGKGACAIYAEADCAPSSKLMAQWKNRKKPTVLLTPGSQWLFGEKEKIVKIEPEIDGVAEEKHVVEEAKAEQPAKAAADDKSEVTKIEEGSYEIIKSDAVVKTETSPRLEAIHIPLTIDIRSWQCVDKY